MPPRRSPARPMLLSADDRDRVSEIAYDVRHGFADSDAPVIRLRSGASVEVTVSADGKTIRLTRIGGPQHGKVTRLAFAPGARLRSGTKRAAGRKTATRRKVARKTPNPARLTARQRVVLNRIVARAKRAITKDVRDGVVPRSVRTIGGLGDYVDQNMYFLDAAGDLDPEVEAMQIDLGRDGVDQQPMWDFLTLAMDRVESWMKAGGLTRISAARKVSARKRMSRRTPNPSAPSRMSFFEVYDAGGGGFEIVRAQSAQSVERKYRGASARRLRDSEIGEGDLNYFGPNGTRVTEAMRDEHRRATARLR